MKAVLITLAILEVPAWANAAQAAEPAIKPNIVFIMADDHGRQAASCYGGKLVRTPNIDRLAHKGMRFDQAMACNSICSPSRAVLITGKYNHVCGVRKLGDYAGRAPQGVADQLIWSRLLQQCEPQYGPIKGQFSGDRAHDTRLMYQEYVRNYLRLVVALDENVGRVLDYLDRAKLAGNTVVIYTSQGESR